MGNFVLECSPWGYLYKLQQFNFHEPLAAWLHEIQKEINLKKQIIRIWLFDILFITMQNILTTIINLSILTLRRVTMSPPRIRKIIPVDLILGLSIQVFI